jgi:hypothetical protein
MADTAPAPTNTPTNSTVGISKLHALALLYASKGAGAVGTTFGSYVDTRFETTFDVLSRSALKSFEVDVLGDGAGVYGVVLNPNVSDRGNEGGFSVLANKFVAALGMVRPSPIAMAKVMIIGSMHTDLLEIPDTYGDTPEDKNIIDLYPDFYYAPMSFPLIPGSFVWCKFDKGTYQSGVITNMDTTMPPYVLSGEAYTPLSENPNWGNGGNLANYLDEPGPKPIGDPPEVILRARSLGYKTWTTPWKLWLYGIRSKNRVADTYDDQLGVVYVDDNEQWHQYVWPGTTDPGYKSLLLKAESLQGAKEKGGTAILVPGQYLDTWTLDKHGKYKYLALTQRGGRVTVYRDPSEDKQLDLDPATKSKGWFGINIHASVSKGTPINATRVGMQSAGCQVHAKADGFTTMMALSNQQILRTGHKRFSYTLFDTWQGA